MATRKDLKAEFIRQNNGSVFATKADLIRISGFNRHIVDDYVKDLIPVRKGWYFIPDFVVAITSY